jgi:hypothetical protein
MGYDTLVECMKDYVRQARVGELSSECCTIASDASEVAVGGGAFVPKDNGMFVCTKFAHHMLRIMTKGRSSSLREMEGIVSTIVAMNLPRGSRVVAVVDNEAVWKILSKGSGKFELQKLADFFFLYCLARGIAAFAVWQRRSTSIITFCDDGSRIVDRNAFSAHPGLFWQANDIARKLWGRGFTYDRFGSASQVQPADCAWKLPFNSRFEGAFSSGVDAFTKRWTGHVNWVNAPFSLLGKVLSLLREQAATAAVVIPRSTPSVHQWWLRSMQATSEGVVYRWNLRPYDPIGRPFNAEVLTPERRYGIAVVFFDFSKTNLCRRRKGMPAEVIHNAWVEAGRPSGDKRYLTVNRGWMVGLPTIANDVAV